MTIFFISFVVYNEKQKIRNEMTIILPAADNSNNKLWPIFFNYKKKQNKKILPVIFLFFWRISSNTHTHTHLQRQPASMTISLGVCVCCVCMMWTRQNEKKNSTNWKSRMNRINSDDDKKYWCFFSWFSYNFCCFYCCCFGFFLSIHE